MVPNVALGIGVGITPLPCRLAKQGDVEDIGLAGIDCRRLRIGHGRRDQRIPDGVSVDAIVDLGKSAPEIPIELETAVFVVFEALEFLDQVKLELRAEPGPELESDVLVGIGAAVAPGTRNQTLRPRQRDPLFS